VWKPPLPTLLRLLLMQTYGTGHHDLWAKARRVYALQKRIRNGRYNSCANRCYYACFPAAIAALLARASAPVGSGVMSLYRGNSSVVFFSSTNVTLRYANCGEYFHNQHVAARKADYRQSLVCHQASRASPTRTFVAAVRQRGGVAS